MTAYTQGTIMLNGGIEMTGPIYEKAPHTLFSVAQFLDEAPPGTSVTLTKDKAILMQNNKDFPTIYPRDPHEHGQPRPLWKLPIAPLIATATNWEAAKAGRYEYIALAGRSYQHKVYHQTEQDLVNFVSAIMGNPPKKLSSTPSTRDGSPSRASHRKSYDATHPTPYTPQ